MQLEDPPPYVRLTNVHCTITCANPVLKILYLNNWVFKKMTVNRGKNIPNIKFLQAKITTFLIQKNLKYDTQLKD